MSRGRGPYLRRLVEILNILAGNRLTQQKLR